MPTTKPKPRQAARRPVCIDLFAGAGGLSLGFEQAGFDIAAAVEIDPIHAAAHEFNFPNTRVVCADAKSVSGRQFRRVAAIANGRLDVLIGGPPCQGFSFIGHRILADPRNRLVYHFVRLVEELEPRYVLMENVPGMVAGEQRRVFDAVVSRLQRLGYIVRHQVLNAAEFGVPQNRPRVFLIASAAGQRVAEPPEPITVLRTNDGSPRSRGNRAAYLPLCPSVEDAIGDLPDIDEYPELFDGDELVVKLPPWSAYASLLRGDMKDSDDFSYRRERPARVLTGCRRAAHTATSRNRFARTPQGEAEPVSRFYKLPLRGVANTLRCGTASDRGAFTSPRPIHPIHPRCISVREGARLHSFPDWFWFHQTKWHGFRQIGNAVPPLLARAVAATIIRALGVTPVKPRVVLKPMSLRELLRLTMHDAARHFGVSAYAIPPRHRK